MYPNLTLVRGLIYGNQEQALLRTQFLMIIGISKIGTVRALNLKANIECSCLYFFMLKNFHKLQQMAWVATYFWQTSSPSRILPEMKISALSPC
jgi:hypothetical protein